MCVSLPARQDIIPFFQGVQLPGSATSVQACYLELAQQVRHPSYSPAECLTCSLPR
jgi:hypothetical protein